jgi:hypothetical protein
MALGVDRLAYRLYPILFGTALRFENERNVVAVAVRKLAAELTAHLPFVKSLG